MFKEAAPKKKKPQQTHHNTAGINRKIGARFKRITFHLILTLWRRLSGVSRNAQRGGFKQPFQTDDLWTVRSSRSDDVFFFVLRVALKFARPGKVFHKRGEGMAGLQIQEIESKDLKMTYKPKEKTHELTP